MDFCRDPDSKFVINSFGVCYYLKQLIHKVETKMTVLQQGPATFSHEGSHQLACMDFLTLSHWNSSTFYLHFLCQVFYLTRGIRAHWKKTDQGSSRLAFQQRFFEVQYNWLSKSLAYRASDVFSGLGNSSIGTPRSKIVSDNSVDHHSSNMNQLEQGQIININLQIKRKQNVILE